MRRLLLFAGPLLLAGCGGWPFSHPYDAYGDAPPDSPRGQCERAAYDDPKVKEALANNAGMPGADGLGALAAARQEAVQRCLTQRSGVGLGGGVVLPRR